MDGDVLDRLCHGVDTLVHLAGPNEVRSAADPAGSMTEVVAGAVGVARSAARAGVGQIVYLSTVHVYGARLRPGTVVDEDTACEPRAAYAIARLGAEHVLAAYGKAPVVVLRLTNSVGAPASTAVDRWTLVANDLCRQGVTTGRLVLHSDGTQWRDFVALSDVCEVIADVACKPGALAPGTYNLGSGEPLTVRELAVMVQDGFERAGCARPPLEAPPPRRDPPPAPVVSMARLAAGGYRASTPVRDAVNETVVFSIAHREELSHQEDP
jgi:UDP-glucose 4-epimerase